MCTEFNRFLLPLLSTCLWARHWTNNCPIYQALAKDWSCTGQLPGVSIFYVQPSLTRIPPPARPLLYIYALSSCHQVVHSKCQAWSYQIALDSASKYVCIVTPSSSPLTCFYVLPSTDVCNGISRNYWSFYCHELHSKFTDSQQKDHCMSSSPLFPQHNNRAVRA